MAASRMLHDAQTFQEDDISPKSLDESNAHNQAMAYSRDGMVILQKRKYSM
jgi:hypothetical protein